MSQAAAVDSSPQIELSGITKRFGGVQALTGIDLDIRRGSIHAFVGENGAGKSTLSRIIAGAERPDHGEIRVGGRQVTFRSPRQALRNGITMLTQEGALVPHRSILENVFLGTEGLPVQLTSPRALRRRFAALVAETQLDLTPTTLVRSLSLSDRKKVEVLRAVARNVQVLILDEPTAAATPAEAEQLFQVVRRLHERGTTIVYISHFLDEVLRLADTVTVLRDGRLVRTSATARETPEQLVASMLGRTLDLTFPDTPPAPDGAPVVLSVRDLNRPPVLRDISFEIHAGEILGLAGLVGSGRTEVARALFGADRVERGEVRLEGRPLRARSPRRAIGAGVVMLTEDRQGQGLLLKRSIVDNITLPYLADLSRIGLVENRRARRGARSLMNQLDVRGGGPRTRVSALSGGNQQKVLFARWLFRKPRLFIADEPTRGVDVGAKRAIYELICSLAAEGVAVLLISSEHEEVLGLAHRVLVMRNGQIAAEFDRQTMSEDAVLSAAFGTEAAKAPNEEGDHGSTGRTGHDS